MIMMMLLTMLTMLLEVWDAMSSSDAVLYVRSKLQQGRHRHQLPLSAVGAADDDDDGLILLVSQSGTLRKDARK